jgi:hypothetical protein
MVRESDQPHKDGHTESRLIQFGRLARLALRAFPSAHAKLSWVRAPGADLISRARLGAPPGPPSSSWELSERVTAICLCQRTDCPFTSGGGAKWRSFPAGGSKRHWAKPANSSTAARRCPPQYRRCGPPFWRATSRARRCKIAGHAGRPSYSARFLGLISG